MWIAKSGGSKTLSCRVGSPAAAESGKDGDNECMGKCGDESIKDEEMG